MRAELLALVHELKHLRQDGVETIYLGDDTLSQLREAVARYREKYPSAAAPASAPAGSGAATSAPVSLPPEQRATAADLKAHWTPTNDPMETAKKEREAANDTKGEIAPIPPPPKVALPTKGTKEERWKRLRELVLGDLICQEHVRDGKQIVFGVGSVDASIFFCGEAPGAEEENQGEPFVGPAGQLLTKIIQAMGLSRQTVYIGNIMNWRPEMPTPFGNRPPTPEEMAYCLPYLKAQLAVVQPKVIVALGKTAVDGFLGPDPKRRMGQIRGQWTEFEGIPLIPTFHPSYLLRNNTKATKRQVWEDMLEVMRRLEMPISQKQQGFFL
jgi:DNA polymerase